jgi:mannose-6-phosphate isomerase-like protein (cupin superfamily)
MTGAGDGGPVLVRAEQARAFAEGPERCREYVHNATLWLGTSTLPPGATGGSDPGHPHSTEVFYCCEGHVIVSDGAREYELRAGDVLVVPPGVPHTIRNVGEGNAHLVWAGAPGA